MKVKIQHIVLILKLIEWLLLESSATAKHWLPYALCMLESLELFMREAKKISICKFDIFFATVTWFVDYGLRQLEESLGLDGPRN